MGVVVCAYGMRVDLRIEPLPVITLSRNPGLGRGIGERIAKTLLGMKPGSDESFVVTNNRTSHDVAKRLGIRIVTKREGGMYRVWRV